MLRYGELLQEPSRLDDLDGADVLIASMSTREVLLQESCAGPETTQVFVHETIAMMKAERAERLDRLRGLISTSSPVIPLQKKKESFWDHVTLGRASTADIVFEDPAISNIHAHFITDVTDGTINVQDVGSSNGTYVNREPLQPHVPIMIRTGDCLRFGQSVLYFVSHGALRDLVRGAGGPVQRRDTQNGET